MTQIINPQQNNSIADDPQILSDLSRAVGKTPLLRLNSLTKGLGATVLIKMESMNPLGSVKDRIAVAMLDDAEQQGLIEPGKTLLIEPTSGNTGIALAFVAAARGYNLLLAMPESMSLERRNVLAALGAELELTPAAEGMKGAIARAQTLLSERKNAYTLQQFSNPANPRIHKLTTGPEIWQATGGEADILVAGVGTGGTVSGAGAYLKSQKHTVTVFAVEPKDSPVITQRRAGQEIKPSPHKIQGIGAGFIPENLDLSLLDGVVTVSNEEAFDTARKLARQEGIFAGISSGANVCAALKLASRSENRGKTIVTVACSTGERYISTELWAIK